MVVGKLRNSFSRVAIAGYYGSARVALFVDVWEYVKTTCLGQSWTRGILVYYSQLGYLCVGS